MEESAWGGREQCYVSIFWGKKKKKSSLGHYFSPHLSIRSGSVPGPGCKISPRPYPVGCGRRSAPLRLSAKPKWCTQVNRSALGKLGNGNGGQDGGEKHPLKTPRGAGGGLTREVERSFSARPSLPRSHRAGAALLKSPLHNETLGPKGEPTPSPRGNGNACLHHFVFLLNATMEMVNLFLPILFFNYYYYS